MSEPAGRFTPPADPRPAHRADVLGWHQWLVRDAGTGRVVGTTADLEVSPADARLEVGSTGYSPSVWASAVNPATKLLVLGLAFETLGAGRVQLKIDVRNVRSQQAVARLGAVTAEQWPEVRDGLAARLGSGR